MQKSLHFALFVCLASGVPAASAADLTAQELRWLKAAAPVLAYS